MNDLEVTYRLLKKMINLRDKLLNWARQSRENKLSETQLGGMMQEAHKIDELLREIGVEWLNDYESNIKARSKVKKIENIN